MPPDKTRSSGLAVPSGRIARLARFGGMASGVAGGMLLDGARQFVQGKRPSVSELLLTPANVVKVTHQLAQLRGAAMKIGQLMSMDAGEMLPPELAEILGRLRADAQHMPAGQLNAVLTLHWGNKWRDRFQSFTPHPIAAASIGQVHRARVKDGRDVAIKIQYPGVRRSIDSDVDNVATLMRMSGLVPKTLDVTPMLVEAKRQLHEEADYAREGACLAQFGTLLAGAPNFVVPKFYSDLSGSNVLAMSYVDGVPVESLTAAPQVERDRIVALLIELVLRELFEFQLMQTDPNFANYRYDTKTRQLVLLDFGATRAFAPIVAQDYARLLRAGLAEDRPATRQAAIDAGLLGETTPRDHQDAVMALFDIAMEPLLCDGPYDFARTDITERLRDGGIALANDRTVWHVPPIDTVFLQRKIAGMYLLATRLKARVEIRPMLEGALSKTSC